MPEIITRDQAKVLGLKRYFTGEPCKHGHVGERDYKSRICLVCVSIRIRARSEKRHAVIAELISGPYEIISRQQARDRGLTKYFTGMACRNRHLFQRWTASGGCIKCFADNGEAHRRRMGMPKRTVFTCKEEKRQAQYKQRREYYRRNREQELAKGAAYRPKYAPRRQEISKIWREENRERINQYYRDRNKKIIDLLTVLREEMPDLLKEFGL